MSATKSFYLNESTQINRGNEQYIDKSVGYSLDIPWNDIWTSGWIEAKPSHGMEPVWGTERQLTTRPDPEYWAPDNIVRTTGKIPIINVKDPRYKFQRSKYTFTV